MRVCFEVGATEAARPAQPFPADERSARLEALGAAALGAGVERAEALEAAIVSVLP